MNAHWLGKSGNSQLIVFCNGWGMDHQPLELMDNSGFDVLVLSDYSRFKLSCDIDELVGGFAKTHLIGWSFGVWAAQVLFAQLKELFDTRIAINGTLKPIDDHYGIPHQFFNATLDNFSEAVLDRFYRRMCRPKQILERFLQHRPARKLADQRLELEMLAQLIKKPDTSPSIFDAAIISSHDLIIPSAHQKAFWQDRCTIVEAEGCHYPFAGWQSWSEVIDMAGSDGQ